MTREPEHEKQPDWTLPERFACDLPDCPDCGEAWCPECKEHLATCRHPTAFSEADNLPDIEDEDDYDWEC